MKKILYITVIAMAMLSCSDKSKIVKTDASHMEKVEYVYNDGDKDYNVSITNPPQRVAAFNPYTTEILLALGLENRMVIGSTEGDIHPDFKEAYEKVPQRLLGHGFRMSKEAFLLAEPDFVAGNVKAETAGDPQELIDRGIAPFNLKSLDYLSRPTLDDVYEDIYLLGRIFDVNDKAKEVVEGMKTKLAEAQKTFVKPKEKKKVLILSYRNGIAAFSSLANDLINKAYGVNIYQDLDSRYEFVTAESVLERNPDVIFIIDIKSRPEPIEEKINLFRTDPILNSTNAVKNNQIYEVNLAEVAPGIRNVDFIIKLNKILYQ